MKTQLQFANMACVALHRCELEGQISDGLYENRRPYDHWKWICGVTPILNKEQQGYKQEYSWPLHQVRYSLRSLISHIGRKDDWDWTERILVYGKLGSLIPEDKLEVFWKEADRLGSIFEYGYKEGIGTVEKLLQNVPEWMKDYKERYLECTLLTDELVKKFGESTYSLKDLKRDSNLLSQTVNTYLGRIGE